MPRRKFRADGLSIVVKVGDKAFGPFEALHDFRRVEPGLRLAGLIAPDAEVEVLPLHELDYDQVFGTAPAAKRLEPRKRAAATPDEVGPPAVAPVKRKAGAAKRRG